VFLKFLYIQIWCKKSKKIQNLVNDIKIDENGVEYNAIIELGLLEDLYLPEKSLVNLFCSLRNFTTWQLGIRAVDQRRRF